MIAGTQLQVGLGYATVFADMDFETYSEAGCIWNEAEQKWQAPRGAKEKGLFAVGTAVYARHHTTEILTLSYDLKDGLGVRRWRPSMLSLPVDLFDHIAAGRPIEAHNSMFEWFIWNYCARKKYGFPELPQSVLRCSMSKARKNGYPGQLAALGDVLGLANTKDKEGKRLINKFSIPQKPTKKQPLLRIRPQDDPADAENMYLYCDRDIVTEAEASSRLTDLDPEELAYWHVDQRINQRGVHMDRAAIDDAIAIVEQAHAIYNEELAQITGGIRASQLAQLKEWLLDKHGLFMTAMDEEAIDAMVERLRGDGSAMPYAVNYPAFRALEIRQAIGSASIKKVFAMANQLTDDDRLHCLFNYYAARTGRPTGEGPQPTNLPKVGPPLTQCGACKHFYAPRKPKCPWCNVPTPPGKKALDWSHEMVEEVIGVMRARSYHLLEYYYDEAMAAISGCLRGMFTPAPGHEFICADFNAIEGVVTAQLAGEEWRLEVFRTHGKIYEMSAAKITGVSFDEMMEYKKATGNHHPMRNKIGKFAELALGFGGWVNAMVQFGADEFLTEPEMKDAILGWREASPMIVELWGGQFRGLPWNNNVVMELFGLEGAAIRAMQNPGTWQTYREIAYINWGDTLYCRLPSGRTLDYQRPRLTPGDWFGVPVYNLSYEGWNTNPKNGPKGWIRIDTYGGRLAENVVQATARDLQRNAQMGLEVAGYPIVLHVYDENVSEVPEGYGSVEEYETIMRTMPSWAQGWPIKATGGWRGKRYRKD
jgi:DNA polymerase